MQSATVVILLFILQSYVWISGATPRPNRVRIEHGHRYGIPLFRPFVPSAVRSFVQVHSYNPSSAPHEVLYELSAKAIKGIRSTSMLVSLNGSQLRLFGPDAGLQPQCRNLSMVETLSDHAPMNSQGIFAWNIMTRGRVLVDGDQKYTNMCFRDVEAAFESGSLNREIESPEVFKARVHAIVWVILDMIAKCVDFKVFFIQEVTHHFFKLLESDEFTKEIRRLNLLVIGSPIQYAGKLTIINKSALPAVGPASKKSVSFARFQSHKKVRAIAKTVSGNQRALDLASINALHAMKFGNDVFINMHVRPMGSAAFDDKAAMSNRAAAILEFASKVSRGFPECTVFIGGDMNTYIDRIHDLSKDNPLISVHEGNAANGKDGRIPETHPIDAIIVHRPNQNPLAPRLQRLGAAAEAEMNVNYVAVLISLACCGATLAKLCVRRSVSTSYEKPLLCASF